MNRKKQILIRNIIRMKKIRMKIKTFGQLLTQQAANCFKLKLKINEIKKE